MKYNFNLMNSEANPFLGLILEVNQATNGLWGIAFLSIIFIVSQYAFIKRTQDIAKSSVMALHICTVLGIILYYTGKVAGHPLLGTLFLITLIILEISSIAALYFTRSKGV